MLLARLALAAAAFATTVGCGYIGPVLPPSPQIPDTVTDLSAIERGNQILITFTAPIRTTDNLIIGRFSTIDLRVGSEPLPFDFEKWALGARAIPITESPQIDPNDPRPAVVTETLSSSDWVGQHIVIAVRTAVKKNDHFSAWSNRAVLDVVAPLQPPVPKAISTAKGILLSWGLVANANEYRIYRRESGNPNPLELGTSTTPDYLDTTAQYDIPYTYSVVAVHGSSESTQSEPFPITAVDKFPPSVPTSITALAAPGSIEVSWQRSPESDLKGYLLYRATNSGPFNRMGGVITLPTYSDHDVQHGNSYRYQVSAVDQKGNESEKSPVAEASF